MSFPSSASRAKLSAADAVLLGSMAFVLPGMADGLYKEALYRIDPALFAVADFMKFVILPTFVLVWLRLWFNVRPLNYGLRSKEWHESCGMLFGATLVATVVLGMVYRTGLQFGWLVFRPTPPTFVYSNAIPANAMHWPVVLYFSVTAGLVEEIFMRGLPLLYLRMKFGTGFSRPVYVVGTAVLFALIHWENGIHELLATFAYGLLAAAMYLNLRNLWPLIVAHVLLDIWAFA